MQKYFLIIFIFFITTTAWSFNLIYKDDTDLTDECAGVPTGPWNPDWIPHPHLPDPPQDPDKDQAAI